jgi:hypothetical protein
VYVGGLLVSKATLHSCGLNGEGTGLSESADRLAELGVTEGDDIERVPC